MAHKFLITTGFKSVRSPVGEVHEITFKELIEELKTPNVRAVPKQEDFSEEGSKKYKRLVDSIKKSVELWSPIVWEHNQRDGKNFRHASMLAYDHDHIAPARMESCHNWLKENNISFVAHTTFTPGRWRTIIPLSMEVLPSEYKKIWSMGAGLLGLEIGEDKEIDPSGHDLARFFFEPTVQEGQEYQIRYHEGELLSPDDIPSRGFDIDSLPNQNVRRFLKGAMKIKEGERDNTLQSITGVLAFQPGAPTLEQFKAMLPIALSQLEGDKEEWTLVAVEKYERAQERRQFEENKRRSEINTGDWQEQFIRLDTKLGPNTGKIDNHTHNIGLILENDENFKGRVRLNKLTQELTVTNTPLEKYDVNSLSLGLSDWLIASKYRLKVTRHDCEAAFLALAKQYQFSPIVEYLDSLIWDGIPRIDNVLLTIANAKGRDDYLKIVSRKFLLGAVARAYEPGCKMDTVLTLKGPQGAKKTTFAEVLGGPFFVETRVDVGNKDAVQIIQRGWIVELSEMAGLQTNYETVRGYLSCKEDTIRIPYDKAPSKLKRQCVFIATTNSETMLSDPDGSRRYWVVDVSDIDIETLREQRDQIWAEAVYAYKMKEQWWLTDEQQRISAEENSPYQETNTLDYTMVQWLHDNKGKYPKELTTLSILRDIYNTSTTDRDRGILTRAGRVLTKAGWIRKRVLIEEHRVMIYIPPGESQYEQ